MIPLYKNGSEKAIKKGESCMNDIVACASASGPILPEMRQNVQADTDLHLPWLPLQLDCQEDENMPGFI